ncbi:hypothetical protein [Pedobacter sp.]|uniref:hypothetical protein n=1 Tax=Pedobacter sp. TaxID=1411316 RepID=UPI003D7F1955
MGASFGSLIPYIFRFKHNYWYVYDAWPRFHQMIAEIAKILDVKVIFFSSSRVTHLFNQLNSGVTAIWIPEGINMKDYYFESYSAKTIDVLEFGRKYDLYHDKITETLAHHQLVHIYEKYKGKMVFGSRNEFLKGLASAKISICIPSNITHPERSEGISSMTLRYLQSMASKCLIVGIIPEEMKLLFDYMPIIEIDMNDPTTQILDILSHYESYHNLIEKNFNEVQKYHTWNARIEKMIEYIEHE